MSIRLARRLLDDEGYSLACRSATETSLGQIAAIVSWQGTARLWTTYFTLDAFLDMDLKLASSSWTFLATLMERLPTPWPSAITRIIAELNSSQEPAEEGSNERTGSAAAVHTCRTYLEAFSDTVSLTGSETSYAGSDVGSVATSSASADSARTPTRVASSVDVSIAGTEDGEIEAVDGWRTYTPMSPCRRSSAGDNEAVQQPAPTPSYASTQTSSPEDHGEFLNMWSNSKEVPDSWYDPKRFA